ncbi:uncharacterized protein LOC132612044 [Lycium barbarum]|uniref:uncharacterized protein LOC132612044 n=1 Tax=Lycium barbarum TaxID=112863 RepID=UPI00293E0365|nr:uncharacterized protein LOC132612044 [Lycium barbarum]
MVKGRRKRTLLKKIKDSEGSWITNLDEIASEAVPFYQKQFSQEDDHADALFFNHVPEMVSQEDNEMMCATPTIDEVKNVVFELSGESASGPDGLSGLFHQACWDIVGNDVLNVVKAFWEGHTLPKSITHTNLVLLPKKNDVETLSDMRPIILNNFINKVMSRVIHDRMDKVLPSLISANQYGFVKGRNIIENVLLAQEFVSNIRLRGKPTNVVINLDTTKAYDRVS